MNIQRFLRVAQALMAQPTAPFHEDLVRGEILVQLAQCPNVKVQLDGFGNIVAHYKRGEGVARWLLTAHMDHPAYVGDEFLGGVPEAYLQKRYPTRDFGAFAMWDLPSFDMRDGCIYSRACDDLIGCAVLVWMLLELEQQEVETAVSVSFTCAEEVGLLGAVYLARSGAIPKNTAVLSLETSAEMLPARMHHGVVVRAGDRTSLFDSELTGEMVKSAKDEGIPFQRCLMSGGTCEATAYEVYGYRVAGVCVPLGNYHNCGPNETIAAEYVSLADVEAMARLCMVIASGRFNTNPRRALRESLETRLASQMWRCG